MTEVVPLSPLIRPEIVTLTKGPPQIDAARLERSARAAFERHVAQRVAEGTYISAAWETIDEPVRVGWRIVVRAALEAWESSR